MTRALSPDDFAFPAAAVGVAALVAFAVSIAPTALLENMISASGLPALFPAAAPPLGAKARALLSFVCGSAAALALLSGYLLLEYRARATRRRPQVAPSGWTPSLRRSDTHPDAPARRPIFAAADLGAVDEDAYAEPETPAADDVAGLLARFEHGLDRRRMTTHG